MKGSMQISKLRKKAAYYCSKSFDEGYGGEFTLFIEPFKGTYDNFFYYVKKLENGSIEIMGEGYIVTDKDSLASHKRDAKKELGNMCPAYYWLDEKDKQIDKTYL